MLLLASILVRKYNPTTHQLVSYSHSVIEDIEEIFRQFIIKSNDPRQKDNL